MSSGWAAAIAAAASAASSMYASNQAGKEGDYAYVRARDLMRAQQKYQQNQLEKVMQYDTEMANTAHQREVADLKAAGLNPILSSGGNGAASPTLQGGGAPGSPSVGINNAKIEAMMNMSQLALQNRAVRVQEKNQASEQLVNQEKVQTMKSEQGLNNANAELAAANKLYKNAELEWLPKQVKQSLKESASRIMLNSASSVKQLAEKELAIAGTALKQQEQLESQSRTWRNYNQSLGSDSWGASIGPVKFNESHGRYGERPRGGSGIN